MVLHFWDIRYDQFAVLGKPTLRIKPQQISGGLQFWERQTCGRSFSTSITMGRIVSLQKRPPATSRPSSQPTSQPTSRSVHRPASRPSSKPLKND